MDSVVMEVWVDKGGLVAPGGGQDAGGGSARFHPGRPTAPTKAQEGPLVETPKNGPVSGVLPPMTGLLPVTPRVSQRFSDSKTLNGNHGPPSFSL